MNRLVAVIFLALSAAAFGAWAHTGSSHAKTRPKPPASEAAETQFGRPAERRDATRTVRIDMNDTMRFAPSVLRIKQGETVRFVVKNSGRILHEIVLGTMHDLKEHAELMRKFPDMEHHEPHMLHVDPGKTGVMVWKFTKAGEFHYGCLIPGHFEAGMVGRIVVSAR